MEALSTPPLADASTEDCEVTVVLPCLDEAASVASCVRQAATSLLAAGLVGEVLVVDNGSTDGSPALAAAAGAHVVYEPRRGYGNAYLAGFAAARGRYIVMADADGTYDLSDVPRFVDELEAGADLVMGSRLRGRIEDGAMPWLHRHVGNPFLTGMLNAFSRTRVSDAHCGMRGFRRSLLPQLDLQATGMELASEHLIRSAQLGLDIREIPIDYAARSGESKLETFSDGWRHLRLLLVHSPTWLFLIPGLVLALLGLAAGAVALTPALDEARQLHGLIFSGILLIVGCQVLQFGVFARSFAAWQLGRPDSLFDRVRRRVSLESLLLAGALVAVAGAGLLTVVGIDLARGSFAGLGDEKLAVTGLTVFVIGVQVVFASFLLSILGLRRRRSEALLSGAAELADEPAEAPRPLPLG